MLVSLLFKAGEDLQREASVRIQRLLHFREFAFGQARKEISNCDFFCFPRRRRRHTAKPNEPVRINKERNAA